MVIKIKVMIVTICAFAGHREEFVSMYKEKLEAAISEILKTDNVFIFYVGGRGHFDSICTSAVKSAKKTYLHLNISLFLVLPHMTNKVNTNKQYYDYYFDDIIIPIEFADVHYKAKIKKRNQWMVDRADYLIACVFREFGGAFDTMKYALKQGKQVLNIAEES